MTDSASRFLISESAFSKSSSSIGSSSASTVRPVYSPLRVASGHTSTSTSKSTPSPGLNFSSILATASSSAILACPIARISCCCSAIGTAAPMICSHASALMLCFPKWFRTIGRGALPLLNPGISACLASRPRTDSYALEHSSALTWMDNFFTLPGRSSTSTLTAILTAVEALLAPVRNAGKFPIKEREEDEMAAWNWLGLHAAGAPFNRDAPDDLRLGVDR
mmetsp:Transcript_34441/g.71056  ORF Transcript_34441/g.71056 Transcript_34441/m.71056 type:complete len:222 (-) Transcript_34441:95-760(-)